MPHSLILNLQSRSPIPPGYLTGKHLHALFLTLVSSVDQSLGDRPLPSLCNTIRTIEFASLPSLHCHLAMTNLDTLEAASRTLASVHPKLRLLVLFGSRARGEDDSTSDWDFAFLFDSEDPVERKPFWFCGAELLSTLSQQFHVSEDAIDLVDLSACSDILAHFVARDGQVIYEKAPGEFAQFQQQALKTKGELKAFRQVQREQVHQALERWGV